MTTSETMCSEACTFPSPGDYARDRVKVIGSCTWFHSSGDMHPCWASRLRRGTGPGATLDSWQTPTLAPKPWHLDIAVSHRDRASRDPMNALCRLQGSAKREPGRSFWQGIQPLSPSYKERKKGRLASQEGVKRQRVGVCAWSQTVVKRKEASWFLQQCWVGKR